jgi:hypothetical protein
LLHLNALQLLDLAFLFEPFEVLGVLLVLFLERVLGLPDLAHVVHVGRVPVFFVQIGQTHFG